MRLLIFFVATAFRQIVTMKDTQRQHHAQKIMNVNEGAGCVNMWKAHESFLLVSTARTLVRKVCRARTPSHVWACPHPIPIRSTVENTASAEEDDRQIYKM